MISIKYCGTLSDPSGYGQSNRADVMALYVAGANLTTEVLQQTQFRTTYGIQENVIKYLENRDIPYKIKILHITPDLYPKYMEEGIYHIGRLVWETDKLPESWIEPCNKMNEIWTTTPQHAEIMRKSGITVPIYDFPEPIEVREANEKITPFSTKFKKDFTFYSIFQWIDRKNPKGLLRAYWKAFEGNDDVTLLLKTYRVSYDPGEFKIIEQDIENWKKELNQKHYPKVWLVEKLFKGHEIKKLHMMGDCYVNPSSGEGWGRPVAEAMLYGKPVISGDNGGVTDIIPNSSYFVVPSTLQKATTQSWIPWYKDNQNWKVMNEKRLEEKIREIYSDPASAQFTAKIAQEFVVDNFNLQTVGAKMLQRLEKINDTL